MAWKVEADWSGSYCCRYMEDGGQIPEVALILVGMPFIDT